jgi:sugar/nucleoside kinase (ribokinase family)
MNSLAKIEKPDYVVIGHITQDISAEGLTPGGTALYSGLTAHALGLKVGILSSLKSDFELPLPPGVQLTIKPSDMTSRFKNIQTPAGRQQYIYQKAADLNPLDVPAHWLGARVVHLGPVAGEVDPRIMDRFEHSLICLTPQGWMREWSEDGLISYKRWMDCENILSHAQIASFSIEDVQYNEAIIEEISCCIPVLAVTEAQNGARVYWNGDMRRFRAPQMDEIDVTGAGDIFAAAFFCRYSQTHNPWEAARFAILLASNSITRKGLQSIPTSPEIMHHHIEIIEDI